MLNRLGLNRHVTDADLTAVWTDSRTGEATQTAASAHLRECPACRARLASLSTWLDGMRDDARHEADEAFPRERLAAQQAQILRRLEAMERPARVLAFPRFTRAISGHHIGRQRLIAAAAAAGLLVGIGLGQTFDISSISPTATPDALRARSNEVRTANTPDRIEIRPISAISDEDFLYDRDSASLARVPESLRWLNEITPGAREYDSR